MQPIWINELAGFQTQTAPSNCAWCDYAWIKHLSVAQDGPRGRPRSAFGAAMGGPLRTWTALRGARWGLWALLRALGAHWGAIWAPRCDQDDPGDSKTAPKWSCQHHNWMKKQSHDVDKCDVQKSLYFLWFFIDFEDAEGRISSIYGHLGILGG